MNNPYLTKVPANGMGRRFAIGDIHGCLDTLRALVEDQLQLTTHDQLFPLGDYIDRGPSSSGVIDYIIDLQVAGFEVYPLKGNHEDMFLDSYQDYVLKRNLPDYFKRLCKFYNAEDLLDAQGHPIRCYREFMEELHYCIDVGEGYLVHANLSPGEYMLRDFKTMLWSRNTNLTAADLKGKWLLRGHTPMDINMMRKLVKDRYYNISLDNGCVYYGSRIRRKPTIDLGRLCALDLDSFELFEQEYRG